MQKQVISSKELRSIVSEAGDNTKWTTSTNVAVYFDMETVTVDDITQRNAV